MSTGSTNSSVAVVPVTPRSSPAASKPLVCPGAPARVVRPIIIQPMVGVGRKLELGNMGSGAANSATALAAEFGSMGLGSE